MTEGTKSYLIGCHQFFLHPLWVIVAWRKVHGCYPRFWELICIFIHGIGVCGRQYLSVSGAKRGHWERGAVWAYKLFGYMGYALCAGHTSESGEFRSLLSLADKYSWLVAPMWWLRSNYRLENFKVANPVEWKAVVAQALEKEAHFSCHELYERKFSG